MRVLYLIDSLRSGGKERQFVELLKGLNGKTDLVVKVVLFSDVIEYTEFARLEIDVTRLVRNVKYDPAIFWRLHKLIREFKPDVVHSWHLMCSLYAVPTVTLLRIPLVNGFVRDVPPRIARWSKTNVLRCLTLPFSAVVVGNSRAGLEAYEIPTEKRAFIHNGLDQTRLSGLVEPRETLRLLGIEREKVVGMVASFSEYKDYDSFFDMAKRISARRNDVAFLAVGSGPRFAEYEHQMAGYFPQIQLLGHRDDVENVINAFSVGVLLSPLGEGMSNSIMEYMALGKPVVATDWPGTRELVEHGKTGFLVGKGDIPQLTSSVLELLDDPDRAQDFGELGRSKIRDDFSLNKMVHDVVDIYRKLTIRSA